MYEKREIALFCQHGPPSPIFLTAQSMAIFICVSFPFFLMGLNACICLQKNKKIMQRVKNAVYT